MKYDESNLDEVMRLHKLYFDSEGKSGELADFSESDLKNSNFRNLILNFANFENADLSHADFWHTNLENANFKHADLKYTEFINSELMDAKFNGADLSHAKFNHSNLNGAYFRYAIVKDADFDYSGFPLWCGSFDMIVDQRLPFQLAYHICRMKSDDPEVKRMQGLLKEFANKSHIIVDHDCELIE